MSYRDPEEIIEEFWECSIRNDFSEFDWDEAFESFENKLRQLLIEHGYLGLDEYRDFIRELYGDLEGSLPVWAGLNNNFVVLSKAEIVDSILASMIAAYEKANLHPELRDLYERLSNRSSLDEKQKIALFDACIHAEHCTGYVWEIDVEDLRIDFEKKAKKIAQEALMI